MTDEFAQWRDLEAIKALKYRYLRTLDTQDWTAFEECLVPEATSDYAGLAFADRAALVDYLRTNLVGIITMHHCHHPEIELSGDQASGRWALHDKVLVPEHRFVLEGAAFYDDHYRRTPTGWRIAHTGYARTHETSYSMDDLAGFRLSVPSTPAGSPRHRDHG